MEDRVGFGEGRRDGESEALEQSDQNMSLCCE